MPKAVDTRATLRADVRRLSVNVLRLFVGGISKSRYNMLNRGREEKAIAIVSDLI